MAELLDRAATTYVAGHRGLVGCAIWRRFQQSGFTRLIGRSSTELDLRDRQATFEFIREIQPRQVVIAAARVGGILANDTYPVEFLSDNLQIQVNLMDAALEQRVDRLLFLGSSCIYPRLAPQPIPEDALLTGPLESTNDAYAIAKIAGIMQVRSVRKEFGLRWISAMPTNMYGPGDNFTGEGSHVLPALIRRYVEAVESNRDVVCNWASGSPLREFLHVDDLAAACEVLLDRYDDDQHINVGTGDELTIKELSELVASAAGYDGRVEWDSAKPDGTPRKVLDVTRIKALGWESKVALRQGIGQTVSWYRANRGLSDAKAASPSSPR
jgi:GDP-L-fucose synthase